MDTILQAALIGVLQGLTEFLPISSSAHLILVPRFLGWDDPFLNSAAFDVMLHVGTLVALLAYFRTDLLRLLRAGAGSLRGRSLARGAGRRRCWAPRWSPSSTPTSASGQRSSACSWSGARPSSGLPSVMAAGTVGCSSCASATRWPSARRRPWRSSRASAARASPSPPGPSSASGGPAPPPPP